MSTEHLHPADLQTLARLALGREGIAGTGEASPRQDVLVHLRTCSLCQERLSAASAALEALFEDPEPADGGSSNPEQAPGPEPLAALEDLLTDYAVVDLEACETERSSLAESSIRLAAAPTRITSIFPARDRARSFRSADNRLTIDVREDSRDDACYVYLLPKPEIDRDAVRLYIPPGLVERWPESGYFRYPRYTYDAVDWSRLKLLYPRRASG